MNLLKWTIEPAEDLTSTVKNYIDLGFKEKKALELHFAVYLIIRNKIFD